MCAVTTEEFRFSLTDITKLSAESDLDAKRFEIDKSFWAEFKDEEDAPSAGTRLGITGLEITGLDITGLGITGFGIVFMWIGRMEELEELDVTVNILGLDIGLWTGLKSEFDAYFDWGYHDRPVNGARKHFPTMSCE